MLPFIEQQSLYNQINFSKAAFAESVPENSSFSNASMERGPAGDAVNMLVANSQPSVFVCPSAYRVKPENQFKDYAINGGTGACCPDRAFSDAEVRYMDGVAYVNSHIPLQQITDGTSTTFLFLELAHWAEHSWADRDLGCNQFIFVHHISQGYVNAESHDGSVPMPPNTLLYNNRGAHGTHPGGLEVAMCDGHVTFISNFIDFRAYRAMFTRAGGEVVDGAYLQP